MCATEDRENYMKYATNTYKLPNLRALRSAKDKVETQNNCPARTWRLLGEREHKETGGFKRKKKKSEYSSEVRECQAMFTAVWKEY
jgi:hypothetical protein